MAKYLNDLFPNTLDTVKDGKGGSCRCLNYWVAELILQSAYQRYARGLRLFYNFKVVASQESYPFGDIIHNGLKTWDLPEFRVLGVDPPGLSRAELNVLLVAHPRQYGLAVARDFILGLGGGLPPETSDESGGGDGVVGSSGDESSNATGDSNLVGSGGTLEGTEENPIVISDVDS